MLVEERGLKEFAFLPCIVNNVSAVQESFRVMASNGYHTKKPYELMHEITEMEKLLREHPEEFPPSLQKGRMVERLSKKMGIAMGYSTGISADLQKFTSRGNGKI